VLTFKFKRFGICLPFPFFGWFLLAPVVAAPAFGSLLLPFGFPVFLWWALEGAPLLRFILVIGVHLVSEAADHLTNSFCAGEIRASVRFSRAGESVVRLSSSMVTGSVADTFRLFSTKACS
jgi:hypothetical protein